MGKMWWKAKQYQRSQTATFDSNGKLVHPDVPSISAFLSNVQSSKLEELTLNGHVRGHDAWDEKARAQVLKFYLFFIFDYFIFYV